MFAVVCALAVETFGYETCGVYIVVFVFAAYGAVVFRAVVVEPCKCRLYFHGVTCGLVWVASLVVVVLNVCFGETDVPSVGGFDGGEVSPVDPCADGVGGDVAEFCSFVHGDEVVCGHFSSSLFATLYTLTIS